MSVLQKQVCFLHQGWCVPLTLSATCSSFDDGRVCLGGAAVLEQTRSVSAVP